MKELVDAGRAFSSLVVEGSVAAWQFMFRMSQNVNDFHVWLKLRKFKNACVPRVTYYDRFQALPSAYASESWRFEVLIEEAVAAEGLFCPSYNIEEVLDDVLSGISDVRKAQAIRGRLGALQARLVQDALFELKPEHLRVLAKVGDVGQLEHFETFFKNATDGALGNAFKLSAGAPGSGLKATFSPGRTVADELFDAVDAIPLGQGVEGAEEFLKVFSVPNEYAIRGAYGEAKALKEILEDGDVIESVFDWVHIPRISTSGKDYHQRVQGVDGAIRDAAGSAKFIESKVMTAKSFDLKSLTKQYVKHLETKFLADINDAGNGFRRIGTNPVIVYSLKGTAFTVENVAKMKNEFLAACKNIKKLKRLIDCEDVVMFSSDPAGHPPLIL